MLELKRITKAYETAAVVPFRCNSKIVIMSDCHRGNGSTADNFAKNQNLFFAAITQYYNHGFTYIELGDGDELWENDKISEIIESYDNIFWLLSKFHREGRLYMIYGNHDMIKGRDPDYGKKMSLPGIKFHEAIILQHEELPVKLFLLHGHQADILNDTFWRLSRFLVRYLWRPLELLGINNPLSAATNPNRKLKVERVLIKWVGMYNRCLIAGHTHRPVFPGHGEARYFNDGSCVHPRCITALEITDDSIALVKWSYKTRFDGTLYVGRDEVVGPEKF
ncbi:hypothetical protein MASR2M70_18630 [Bacillota bacterium]